MKLTKGMAKFFSLVKWWILKTTGWDAEYWVLNVFDFLRSGCGYCEKYCVNVIEGQCAKCPLQIIWNGTTCFDPSSAFKNWLESETRRDRIKYATIIYNDIKKS